MDHKKSTGNMAKALAEFKFRRLENIFMEPSDYGEIPLYSEAITSLNK
jgi:hypothetical protein